MAEYVGAEKPSLVELAHHGVKGMKWGHRKAQIQGARKQLGSLKEQSSAAKSKLNAAKKSGDQAATSKALKEFQTAKTKQIDNRRTALTLTRGEQIAVAIIGGPVGAVVLAGGAFATRDSKKIKVKAK